MSQSYGVNTILVKSKFTNWEKGAVSFGLTNNMIIFRSS